MPGMGRGFLPEPQGSVLPGSLSPAEGEEQGPFISLRCLPLSKKGKFSGYRSSACYGHCILPSAKRLMTSLLKAGD